MCNAISYSFHEDLEISTSNYSYNRPDYPNEINKVIEHLDTILGNSYRSIRRKKLNVEFGEIKILKSQYPWKKIQEAQRNFPEYLRTHAEIFDFELETF